VTKALIMSIKKIKKKRYGDNTINRDIIIGNKRDRDNNREKYK
jgi:hypothetical protein